MLGVSESVMYSIIMGLMWDRGVYSEERINKILYAFWLFGKVNIRTLAAESAQQYEMAGYINQMENGKWDALMGQI